MRVRTLVAVAMLWTACTPASAEVSEITVAQGYGAQFLPLMIMERNKLVEKHATALGIDKLQVNWKQVVGPSVMNDGLLSGTVHYAAMGVSSMITLWSKTKNNVGIRGLAATTTYPVYLNTRNPDVKSIKDLSSKDRIAVPSVKVSMQALLLQMVAAKEYGEANYAKFDPLTVTLAHPEAVIALTNNTAGINAHFTVSPFHEQELKIPGVRTIATNYEILGGPATALVFVSTSKFRDANPKVNKAVFDALKESIEIINRDKQAAAKVYIDMMRDKFNTADDISQIISSPDYHFTLTPGKTYETALFMKKLNLIDEAPASWKDLYFPDIHGLPGD